MATGALTTINNATPANTTLPIEAQHLWDLSPQSQIVMLGQHKAPLYMRLTRGLGLPMETTTDKKFKILSEHPMIRDILITGSDGAGSAAVLGVALAWIGVTDISGDITDANKLLRVGDKIWVHSYQANQKSAIGTVAAGGETMRVESITADGLTVTVTRNIGSDVTTRNVTTTTAAHTLAAVIMPYSRGERSESRAALAHAMIEDYNYIETFEEPFDVTEDIEETLSVGGSTFNREQNQKLMKFLADIEDELTHGQRDLVYTDEPKYSTGGIMPYVTNDLSTNYAAYSATTDLVTGNGLSRLWQVGSKDNFTIIKWMTFIERAYSEGGPRKAILVGPGFHTNYLQTLEGYIQLPLTDRTGASIGIMGQFWHHAYGEPLEIIIMYSWKGTRSNDALLIDYDYIGLKGFGKSGGNIFVWKGKGGTGLQANSSPTLKHAWKAQIGMNRKYQLAHAAIIGMQNDDNSYGGPLPTVGTRDPSDT